MTINTSFSKQVFCHTECLFRKQQKRKHVCSVFSFKKMKKGKATRRKIYRKAQKILELFESFSRYIQVEKLDITFAYILKN